MFVFSYSCLSHEDSARPSKGWSVNILPVRSTAVVLARMLRAYHAFNPATEEALLAPFKGAVTDAFTASGAGAFRTRRVEATCRASGDRRKSWKSRSLEKT